MTVSRRTVLTALSAAAAAQAQRQRVNWKPKLGALAVYSESNIDFLKAEGFTSVQLRIDPNKVDDAAISAISRKLKSSGLYVSSLACDGNHIDPDPALRERQNGFTVKCIELCGKLGIPAIGGQSGTMKGRPLGEQVDQIVKVYNEKYFPALEKNKVRILWEPYAGGPNIATGPVGWEALFKAFGSSNNIGLQFDPSHLVWQFMDPVQAARDFVDKIYDVHLKDTEVRWDILHKSGINPVDGARWWLYRLPGLGSIAWNEFFSVLQRAGYQGAMSLEHEDPFYGSPNRPGPDFNPEYAMGFKMAHRYLRQYVPD